MHAIQRILVAIRDPAAKSQPALKKATALALSLGADVQLFHAIGERLVTDPDFADDDYVQKLEQERLDGIRKQLDRHAAPLRRHGLKVTTTVTWDFPAHEAIVRSAMQFGANLIVAAAHARHHALPWLLRYTDWELLRCSPIPVLVIKNSKPWRRPVVLAAVDPSHAFSKPSGLDDQILRCGDTLAEALKGKLHAVYAYSPVPTSLPVDRLSTPGALEESLAKAETRALADLKAATEPFVVPRAQLHVEARHPGDAIRDVARETGAQVVALGSISRSGLERVIIGNTAETLIDLLECDLLIVKPPYFHHGVERTPRGARVVNLPAMLGGF